jgi:ribosomal-protein-alanine acetyltransferase
MTAPELTIRRMTEVDLDRVMEIAAGLDEAPHWSRPAYEQALSPEHTPRRIALVAADERAGVAIGFAVASLLPPEAELETICVARESQRGGVGGRLLRELIEELRAAGVSDLNLEVRASNGAAVGLYLALGFAETGRRPRYYADPEEDALLMRLRMAESAPGERPRVPGVEQ